MKQVGAASKLKGHELVFKNACRFWQGPWATQRIPIKPPPEGWIIEGRGDLCEEKETDEHEFATAFAHNNLV